MYDFKIIYIPEELNPSDYVRKKTKVEKYLNNPFWHQGPKFLEEEMKVFSRGTKVLRCSTNFIQMRPKNY